MTLLDSYLRIRVTREPSTTRRVRSVELTDPYTGEVLGNLPVMSVSSHQDAQSPQTFGFEVLGDRVDEVVADD